MTSSLLYASILYFSSSRQAPESLRRATLMQDAYLPVKAEAERSQRQVSERVGAAEFRRIERLRTESEEAQVQLNRAVQREPAPKRPANIEFVIPMLTELGASLENGFPFRVQWSIYNSKKRVMERQWPRGKTFRVVNGRLVVSGLKSAPGFVSVWLEDREFGTWSFEKGSHVAIRLSGGMMSADGRTRRVPSPEKIVLRRDIVDIDLIGLPDGTDLLLPDGKRQSSPHVRLARALAEDSDAKILASSRQSNVEKLAQISLGPTVRIYSRNRIVVRHDQWELNSLPGFAPIIANRQKIQNLSDILHLRALETRTGTKLLPQDWNRVNGLGKTAVIKVPDLPINLTVRTVRVHKGENRREGSIPIVEEVAYTDSKAGEIAGIKVGTRFSDVTEILGAPDPGSPDGTASYFQGGLIFESAGNQVTSIRFRRPIEFVREGLRPVPLSTSVAIRMVTQNGRYLDYPVGEIPPKVTDAELIPLARLAAKLVNRLKDTNGTVVPVSKAENANLILTLSRPLNSVSRIIKPHRWELQCAAELLDLRMKRDIDPAYPHAVRDIRIPEESRPESEPAQSAESDIVEQISTYVLRNSIIARVREIDVLRQRIQIEIEHPESVHVRDIYRIRNFDETALANDIVARVTDLPQGKYVWCELVKASGRQRNARYTTVSSDLFNRCANEILAPATGLVFADYLPAPGEYGLARRPGERD